MRLDFWIASCLVRVPPLSIRNKVALLSILYSTDFHILLILREAKALKLR
jgi:hypothetical protein